MLMADNNSVCVCVCVGGCSLPTEAEQSSIITETLSWPSLLLSSTLNGGPCICVCTCMHFYPVHVCIWLHVHTRLRVCTRACVCTLWCVCVQTVDPSRGELLWMRFCSNYCYLFPLKQANCSVAGRSVPTCIRVVCVDSFASLFIVCLCRIADPSNFFSMDTFSLWRQNSFSSSCWAEIWLICQILVVLIANFTAYKKQENYLLMKYNLFYWLVSAAFVCACNSMSLSLRSSKINKQLCRRRKRQI